MTIYDDSSRLRMNARTRALAGSISRDLFKQAHKDLFSTLFACDLDFRLIERNPYGVVAHIDVKGPGDSITFTEVVAYNADLAAGTDVYIVSHDGITALQNWQLTVRQYLGGDPWPNPPTVQLGDPTTINGPEEYSKWERYLRFEWKRRQRSAR